MPFTVSHVAAVLPAYRQLSRWQLFSAAVIGSMVPDFGMIFRWPADREQTHGLMALFTFCLPVGLISYWSLQCLVKPAVIQVLPDRAFARLQAAHPQVRISDWRAWFWAGLAIIGGALTHLAWDGFTHENARGVRMFPMLLEYGPDINGQPVQLYGWLQLASSVVGLLVVMAALVVWMHHAPKIGGALPRRLAAWERVMWGAIYLLIPIAMTALALMGEITEGWSLLATSGALEELVLVAMRAAMVSLVVTSGLLLLRLSE
jgi:hypothetical protein